MERQEAMRGRWKLEVVSKASLREKSEDEAFLHHCPPVKGDKPRLPGRG